MTLRFSPNREEFEAYLDLQLRLVGLELNSVQSELESVYPQIEKQFARTLIKYYRDDEGPLLRLGHNAQYTIFLYHLARAAFVAGRPLVADRIYSLLRMVSSVDLFYEVAMPELWGCDHPLGSVIGRGEFAPQASIFFSQNCNIGNNHAVYPRISGHLLMLPNTSLLGNTQISGNVILSNGACAIDAGELDNCVVFGRSPELSIKPISAERFSEAYPLIVQWSGGRPSR